MISHLQACSILKALPNPSLIVTPEPGFPIRLVNQAYLEIVGIDEANLIGKTVEEVFGSLENKEDTLRLKAFKYSLNKVLVTKESHKMEPVKYCKPDSYTGMQQTTYWIPLNTPVFDKQGEIDFIIHSKTNITDQKLIEEQKSKALLNLRERVKGQSCLYRISNLNEKELSVDELLKEAVTILPDGWQYPDLTEAFIKYDDKKYITPHYTDTMWKLSAEAVVSNGATLAIKVVCLKKNPFPHGEQTFINTIAKHLALKIDQILAQENLERNQQILDKAYRLARIGTWEYDMSAGNLQWSQVTKRVYGLDNDHIPDLETTINLFKKGIDRTTYRKVIHDAIEYKIPFDVELKIISGQGDERWIRATGVPEYRNGVCTRLYGFSQNISERKKAVGELQFSERRFKALVQGGSDLIAIFDEEFRYTYMSPSSETVLGIPAGDLIGTYALENVHKDDKQRVVNDLSNLFATRKRLKIEPYRFADSKGSWRWIETTIINMIKDPTIGGLVTNSRDVTEQKLQQQQLLDSLKEKETLLAEIHHRVKNNMAVVSSLLHLQASREKNPAVTEKLFDSVVRIQTMANIHEQLYRSESFYKLNFVNNIKKLVSAIIESFQKQNEIVVHYNCEAIKLNITQAIPCSLIVNEIITNILKHAFPENGKGIITIHLKRPEKKYVLLTIQDNGIGLPKDFALSGSKTLGCNLIRDLSHQLNADYQYGPSAEGTAFKLLFKKERLKGIDKSNANQFAPPTW